MKGVRWNDFMMVVQGILLIFVLAATVYTFDRVGFFSRPTEYPITLLDDGWKVSHDGRLIGEELLSRTRTGNVKRGENFTLVRTLEKDERLPSACIYFRNLHTAVSVKLDDITLFSEGFERYQEGRLVARSVCYVPLPEDYEGKTLTINMTATENDSFYGLGPFFYGTEQDLFGRFLHERQFAFFVAIFLTTLGVIQILWLPLLYRRSANTTKFMFSALATMVLGAYLMGYYNLFDLVTDIENANTMLEYLALYLISATMAGYISTVVDGRLQKFYRCFVWIDLAFVLLALLLHVFNLVHFTRFILVSYALNFGEAMPFIVMIIRGWRMRRHNYFDRLEEISDRILGVGFLAYVAGSFIDALVFSGTRLMGGQEATVTIPFVTIGSLLFSMAVCANYFLQGVVNLRTDATRQTLESKAYSDQLTGLSNRGECEQVLLRLGRENVPFAVISIDLDGLKQVNDTSGHAEGDRMLHGFALTLKECFADSRLCGRMGGDEFIVVLGDTNAEIAHNRMDAFRRMLEEKNREETAFQYSFSYGIADSTDRQFGRRANDIYMLADNRMYDMKNGKKNLRPAEAGVA